MRHIVSFSTGLSSALTSERVLQRYGKATIIFMDTLIEDDDNYRFKQQMKSRLQSLYDIEFIHLVEGRTPYQVGEDEHIIPNQKIAPCTFRLKIEPFKKYLSTIEGDITIYIGYDWTEVNRIEATQKNYESHGWNVDFPLLWKPIEYRSYTQVSREDWNIEPPRMYKQGYTHANCGGRCVKQGMGDWIRTLIHHPDRFAETEDWERHMRRKPETAEYAILRDQSNGMVRPKTLEELRLEYEASNDQQISLFKLDYQSACVKCGVGDLAAVMPELEE